MGVRHLSTFISEHPSCTQRYTLPPGSVLVVDGLNIMYKLYHDMPLKSSVYTGDYATYARRCDQWFGRFAKCGVRLIVLLDGYAESAKNVKTLQRARDVAGQVASIAKKNFNLWILPIMSRDVFVQSALGTSFRMTSKEATVTENTVGPTVIQRSTVIQCPDEADQRMAQLANVIGCPVLSCDSDFYIFNLPNGFIHADSLEFASDGSISCDLYKHDLLTSTFPGIDLHCLPILAVLAGNDSHSQKDFMHFYEQLPKYDGKHGRKRKLSHTTILLAKIVTWLDGRTFESATSDVLDNIKNDKRQSVEAVFRTAHEGYCFSHDSVKTQPINGIVRDLDTILCVFVHDMIADTAKDYPNADIHLLDSVIRVVSPCFDSKMLQVHLSSTVYQRVPIEDCSKSSVYSTVSDLQDILFSICHRSDDDVIYEYRSTAGRYTRRSLSVPNLNLSFGSIQKLPDDATKREVMLGLLTPLCALERLSICDQDTIFTVSLVIMRNRSQAPPALLLSLAVCYIVPDIDLSKIDNTDFELSKKRRLKLLHHMNEWQLIYSMLLQLNAIFGVPFPFRDFRFFEGSICYSVCTCLFGVDAGPKRCVQRLRRVIDCEAAGDAQIEFVEGVIHLLKFEKTKARVKSKAKGSIETRSLKSKEEKSGDDSQSAASDCEAKVTVVNVDCDNKFGLLVDF